MQNTNLAFALDAQPDETTRESLRDELAQFISEELTQNAPKKVALKVMKRRMFFGNRHIQMDNGIFAPFRVR